LEHDFDEIRDCYQLPQRQQAFAKVANHAQTLMAVSKPMEADMKALFPQAETATLHNGIHLPPDQLKQNPRPPEIQAKQVILACALFAERKAIPLLIEAFAAIAPRYPEAILRIIGSGPQEELIKQTVQNLAMGRQIQLIGKQPHERVLQEMAWADCFALVGYNEPFATVYLEAMAAGKPIICCSDGGITDVINNGEQGYIVPPGDRQATADRLEQILSQTHERQQMGVNARQLIEKSLTWQQQTQRLIQYFQTALKQY
jgi:glycosyltransferase involved in cell wall biosynthesis